MARNREFHPHEVMSLIWIFVASSYFGAFKKLTEFFASMNCSGFEIRYTDCFMKSERPQSFGGVASYLIQVLYVSKAKDSNFIIIGLSWLIRFVLNFMSWTAFFHGAAASQYVSIRPIYKHFGLNWIARPQWWACFAVLVLHLSSFGRKRLMILQKLVERALTDNP